MSRKILTDLDMNQNQLLNTCLQLLPADPTTPKQAQVWFNSVTDIIEYFDGATIQTIASKHYVDVAVAVGGGGVTSFNSRTGAVVLTSADVTTALGDTHIVYTDVANRFTRSPQTVAGSANQVDISGSATTVAPSVVASGTDTDVSLKLGGKGYGFLQLGPDTHDIPWYSDADQEMSIELVRFTSNHQSVVEINLETCSKDAVGATAIGLALQVSTAGDALNGGGGTHNSQSVAGILSIAQCVLGAGLTVTSIVGINGQAIAYGGGTVTNGDAFYGQIQAVQGSTYTNAHGVRIWTYATTNTSGVGTSYAFAAYHDSAAVHGDFLPVKNHFVYWSDDISPAVGVATNAYFLWLDSPGVYRVKGDGVMAYYNANFTKYTPGATAFERVVIQWDLTHNVCEVGTEAGTTGGVLRPLRLIGAGVQIAAEGSVGPVPSAALQVDSTTQGILPSRMTTAQKNAIPSPAEGLGVYDLTLHAPHFWNGTAWTASGGGGGGVTTVSVVPANGFAGTVATSTTTPAITLTTTVTGIIKGNGTALITAVADTDYATPGGVVTYVSGAYVPLTRTVNSKPLSANITITSSDVGLGSVTNDTQTKAAVVPNTAPAAGQILVGNVGGTAYVPVPMSSDATLAPTGAVTLANTTVTPGVYTNANITIDAKGRVTAAASGPAPVNSEVVNAQTGTTYTVADSDRASLITFNNAAPVTVTLAAATVAPTIDGHVAAAGFYGSGTIPLTLTTTKSNDWIVVFIYNENAQAGVTRSVSGVSGAGLTWTRRATIPGASATSIDIWYAFAATPLTAAVLTVSFSGSGDDYAAVAVGVNGAKTGASPFDIGAGLPASSTGISTATATFNTSSANALALAFAGCIANQVPGNSSGWTLIDGASTNAGGLDAGGSLYKNMIPSPVSGATVISTVGGGQTVWQAVDCLDAPAAQFANGWWADFKNLGVGTVTINTPGNAINGLTTLTLLTGQSVRVVSDGVNYQLATISLPTIVAANKFYGGPTSGTPGTASFRTIASPDLAVALSSGTFNQFNIFDYGGVLAQRITDAVISSGALSTLTSATANFTSAITGAAVVVRSAGPGGVALTRCGVLFVNSTTVSLSTPASAPITGATAFFLKDQSTAFNAALAAAAPTRGKVLLPPGVWYFTGTLNSIPPGVTVIGANPGPMSCGDTSFGAFSGNGDWSQAIGTHVWFSYALEGGTTPCFTTTDLSGFQGIAFMQCDMTQNLDPSTHQYAPVIQLQGNRPWVRDCSFINIHKGIWIVNAFSPDVRDVVGQCLNYLINGDSLPDEIDMHNVRLIPTWNYDGASITTCATYYAANCSFAAFGAAFAVRMTKCFAFKSAYGLYLYPGASGSGSYGELIGCEFDSMGVNPIFIAPPTGGGNSTNITATWRLVGCQFGILTGLFVLQNSSASQTGGFLFSCCGFYSVTGGGYRFNNAGSDAVIMNITISGCEFEGYGNFFFAIEGKTNLIISGSQLPLSVPNYIVSSPSSTGSLAFTGNHTKDDLTIGHTSIAGGVAIAIVGNVVR